MAITLLRMPELPEVETVRRGLAQRVTGERIESVWLSDKPQPFKSPPLEIVRILEGSRIAGVRRIGKHIVVDLQDGLARPAVALERARRSRSATFPSRTGAAMAQGAAPGTGAEWIVHLGMTGALQVTSADAEMLKHTHAVLSLGSGKQIRFVDPRRFGRMWVTRGFETFGVEPLQIKFEDFGRLFRGRRTPIKSALLNQKLLRGLGNIYADESLFRAGIRPRRQAGSLTQKELHRLYVAIRAVLREAITAGGSSISDYFDVDGEPGLFQTRHRVYGRRGKPCVVCKSLVKRIIVAGRGTHYCPRCQN